jgi:predicted transcriptional regulator
VPLLQIKSGRMDNSEFTVIIFTSEDSDVETANYLLSLRPEMSNFNIENIDISNTAKIDGINSNSTFKDKVLEFWLIVNDIDENLSISLTSLINDFISDDIPGLILTNEFENTPQSLLTQFEVTSVAEDLIKTEDAEILTLSYPNANNLSNVLNSSVPSTETGSMRLEIANLSINPEVYQIASLEKKEDQMYNPKIPLIYKTTFDSSITIGTFAVKELDLNQEDGLNLNQKQGIIFKTKFTNQIQLELSLLDIISSVSQYQLNSYVESNGIDTRVVTDPQQSGNGIQFAGINLSGFIQSLPAWAIPTGAALGFLGFILYFIRRYWMLFIGIFIAIGTALYIPNRKLDAVQVVHHDSRQRIMDTLLNVQGRGETFRNLSADLEIPTPTLLWHLKILEDFELIRRMKIRREVVIVAEDYYNEFDPTIKELELSFKSDQGLIFRDFLKSLDMDASFTLEGIIRITKWNRKTALRHLNRLTSLGILIKNIQTRSYKINPKYFVPVKELGTYQHN